MKRRSQDSSPKESDLISVQCAQESVFLTGGPGGASPGPMFGSSCLGPNRLHMSSVTENWLSQRGPGLPHRHATLSRTRVSERCLPASSITVPIAHALHTNSTQPCLLGTYNWQSTHRIRSCGYKDKTRPHPQGAYSLVGERHTRR